MKQVRWSLMVVCAAATLLMGFAVIGPQTTPAPAKNTAPAKTPMPSAEILIAAAADLRFAMDSLIAAFSRENPDITVKPTYGSSGNFFQQIKNDAPFDLFFSADIEYPRQLQQQHLTASDISIYGIGQLVLWSKTLDPNKEKMNTLLWKTVTKIAIANPAHAPYGKRAEESLHYYQLYDKIKDKLIFGENIAQTAQFAQSGAAEIGIIALSLAVSPSMRNTGGKYWLIPSSAHQPLQQGFVLLPHSKGNAGAEKFARFCRSQKAKDILHDFGFTQSPG